VKEAMFKLAGMAYELLKAKVKEDQLEYIEEMMERLEARKRVKQRHALGDADLELKEAKMVLGYSRSDEIDADSLNRLQSETRSSLPAGRRDLIDFVEMAGHLLRSTLGRQKQHAAA
jgi:hypothetical protein